MFELILLLLSWWNICNGFETYLEASLFADKIALGINEWYGPELKQSLKETQLYKLSSTDIVLMANVIEEHQNKH